MNTTYTYNEIDTPCLKTLQSAITNSSMVDKAYKYCRFDETFPDTPNGTLQIIFINELSAEDKTKLDIVVDSLTTGG